MRYNLAYITDTIGKVTRDARLYQLHGKVTKVTGTLIRASVPNAQIGELSVLHSPNSSAEVPAEVVGFDGREAILSPVGSMLGVSNATLVSLTGTVQSVPVGPQLLGKVLDGLGNPIGAPPIKTNTYYPVMAPPPDPMMRKIIDRPVTTGLRALDSCITLGEGQRMGIFAAAGVGKSTLLSMLVRHTDTEVVVLALIGERGREVREFIQHDIGAEGLKRSVLVVATSDKNSLERLKAAYVATAIAEYFRDQGKRVLLLMDSVTRFARAQREIGLAVGEPPTRRGFPPSVFSELPKLLERAGNSDKGSITALYTVLVEGDDMTEPVADETRSILDGHIILSRQLAESGHYPAIDVTASVSRVMTAITDPEHQRLNLRLRELLTKRKEVDLLVKVGEYKSGADKLADEAIAKNDQLVEFLRQNRDDVAPMAEVLERLRSIIDR
ncbi:MAG: type III secretion system ATPase SctN [Gammaproteobacteria bacterium]|nr:type III secretion system ATPase SctN [Gammaproteobacteria bacterium]MCY4283464.1 type III secretion system ATPase SctN [Gammaproteobacteria bacterium]MCY4337198.1 type III secretion system ATPase SctN [Gammaproteobacteria bacterium]